MNVVLKNLGKVLNRKESIKKKTKKVLKKSEKY